MVYRQRVICKESDPNLTGYLTKACKDCPLSVDVGGYEESDYQCMFYLMYDYKPKNGDELFTIGIVRK